MWYITTVPKYFPVTKAIREVLQEKLRRRILITRNERVFRNYRNKIILNVGFSQRWISKHFLNDRVINCPYITSLSGNKMNTIRHFRDYVKTIEYFYGIPDTFPVVKRLDINSFHGKGIKFCRNLEEFGEPGVYSPYLNFDSEYRILIVVFDNEIKLMRLFKKDLKEEFRDEEFTVKNAEHCNYYRISNPKLSKLSEFLEGILQAMNEFRNYYFGLDVGRIGRDLFLIETNSAPGMNSISIDEFTNVLLEEVYE